MTNLVPTGDVARSLLVTPVTIRRWVEQGRFPPPAVETPGGRMRFRAEDVRRAFAWLNDRGAARRCGQPEPPAPWAELPEPAPAEATDDPEAKAALHGLIMAGGALFVPILSATGSGSCQLAP